MAVNCPVYKRKVLYLDCIECEEKLCKDKRYTAMKENQFNKVHCPYCGQKISRIDTHVSDNNETTLYKDYYFCNNCKIDIEITRSCYNEKDAIIDTDFLFK